MQKAREGEIISSKLQQFVGQCETPQLLNEGLEAEVFYVSQQSMFTEKISIHNSHIRKDTRIRKDMVQASH
jgi:hypothetical protein